uniref:SpaK n=1 Tax=Spirochaeta aurantia TaxID=147 RepID=Q0PHZ7_SPIAU|nr:SpaK [Spirochaeta aurantia]
MAMRWVPDPGHTRTGDLDNQDALPRESTGFCQCTQRVRTLDSAWRSRRTIRGNHSESGDHYHSGL